ncbi:phosphatidylserine decarboxylase 2 NDAI_0D02040 [Naumovozyma dairenensis CBS 421]|uniref:Phosphatidylserine decarboxylase proenzyme 2 n=1 Tax=Naumovozyma dairenensis (strain ATCC 10597 / BCRC 20456 / CBS 421 / NBRC 0211 / NRRL Y-12639) TaxID=1071378 RepID=G0W9Q7_NAUDC|nr:hypothetical protein NDAI_0D02040 [Naumovozyma dairenensis CBS 421]CCD24518.1 hypothetical protein NDAI_0D02040 [Naumovozyma dairenensis CBS 421]
MRLTNRHRNGQKSRKSVLTLKIQVIQARNIDIIKKFDCSPVCFVGTNINSYAKTNKLKNSNTKWNESIKLKLPRNPNSEWLHLAMYDALPPIDQHIYNKPLYPSSMLLNSPSVSTISLNSQISSSRHGNESNTRDNISPTNTNFNREIDSTQSYSKTSNYLYIGEVSISLLDLFQNADSSTSYTFQIAPKWFTLYDKRRGKNKDLPVGDIKLGFLLESSSKHKVTFKAFNEWKSQLIGNLESRKFLHDARSSRTSVHNLKSISEDKIMNDINEGQPYTRSSNDDSLQLTSSSNSQDQINQVESVLDTDHDLISVASSIFEQNDEDEDEDGDYDDDENSDYDTSRFDLGNGNRQLEVVGDEDIDPISESEDINDELEMTELAELYQLEGAALDLRSMVTALDEYDVVYPNNKMYEPPEHKEKRNDISDVYPSYASSYKVADDEDEKATLEESRSISFDSIGNRFLHLKRRKRIGMGKKSLMPHNRHTTFHVSKKLHATGMIFIKLDKIRNLPQLRNKISRTNYFMDPFIITTFGRRVFKSSWKKHDLNPIFNEYIVFEIYPTEMDYGFHFKVIDKDSFSSNDEIAECSLTWKEMINSQATTPEWSKFELPLIMNDHLLVDNINPLLSIDVKFIPYQQLIKYFWEQSVPMQTYKENYDIIDLMMYLEQLGSFSDEDALDFFRYFGKLAWKGETLTRKQLIEGFQTWNKTANFRHVWKCPSCFRSCHPTRGTRNSKLIIENDLISHFARCTFSISHRILQPSYVSSSFASKRWFSKMLIKLTYGKYVLGSNNANILVEDRDTGIIIEEKISAHVKLGMRIIYNGKGKESKKFKSLLKSMSIRQGRKFDSPVSVKQIKPFIEFHSLDLSDCLDTEYKTFNEFFYRKLKPGSRLPESNDPRVLISPADSRCTMFSTVHQSKEIWIKGDKFSIGRLTQNHRLDMFNDKSCSLGIFRLAPQDYHRFHSPCNGKILKPIYVEGNYYTVNPMAVRSELDIFGENVRVIVPIESPEFGTILFIPIGAMMVGSIILTVEESETVVRGQELGYFKFGGSTIVIVIPSQKVILDSDLLKNSSEGIETLVKVGMSIGHTGDILELKRKRIKIDDPKQIEQIKRTISVTDENAEQLGNVPWQYHEYRKFIDENVDSSTDDIS